MIIITALVSLSSVVFAVPRKSGSTEKVEIEKPRTFTIYRESGAIVERGNSAKTISIPQTGSTTAIPGNYYLPAEKKGSVVRFDYASRDYAGDGDSITKTAYVYLPAGYRETDKRTRYNIFYMMHGWERTADELFQGNDGIAKNVLDHMMESGMIAPTIVVAPTFDAENSPQSFDRSVSEVREFHQDFANNLMPAVESRFNTYAGSSSKKDLIASRDHRAFGGFSLGAVTTWMQFCYNYDYIRYYAPMSASCWYYGGYSNSYPDKTCDFFEDLIKKNDLNERGYFIYACTGTKDELQGQMDAQMNEMLRRKAVFTPDHVVYYKKDGGVHNFYTSVEYMYNALSLFFGK